jgi:hypothetical protein
MAYTVTSDDTAGLAIGPVSETANDVHEALNKARQMYETGLVNVSIKDEAGHIIDGDKMGCLPADPTVPAFCGMPLAIRVRLFRR